LLASVELLRFSERAIDEKPRKSTGISRLPLAHSSFHTVCLIFETMPNGRFGSKAVIGHGR